MKKILLLLVVFFLNLNASMVKMQNDDSWNMAHDARYIYVLTRNYEQDKYKIEIYDKKNLQLIKSKQLNIAKSFISKYKNTRVKIYNKPISIEVSDKYIYIGTNQNIIFYDKKTLKILSSYTIASPDIRYDEKEKIYFTRSNDIDNFTKFKNYIIAYGSGDNIYIFKDDKIVRTINIKKDYPKNITQIHDYFEGSRINTVLVHNNRLYTGNWRGFVNIYDFKSGEFIKQISTIGFDKEYGYVIADEINYISLYQDRWVYMALGYEGVLILDTKTEKLKNIQTFFKQEKLYSELFKEYYENTKSTDIYRMVFYKDNLIFAEVNKNQNHLYVYDLKSNEIVDTFKGHIGDITNMFIENETLFGLSSSGYIYKWNLKDYIKKDRK